MLTAELTAYYTLGCALWHQESHEEVWEQLTKGPAWLDDAGADDDYMPARRVRAGCAGQPSTTSPSPADPTPVQRRRRDLARMPSRRLAEERLNSCQRSAIRLPIAPRSMTRARPSSSCAKSSHICEY